MRIEVNPQKLEPAEFSCYTVDKRLEITVFAKGGGGGGWRGLAATFDLAAFRKGMIAPVKKSVNHSKL